MLLHLPVYHTGMGNSEERYCIAPYHVSLVLTLRNVACRSSHKQRYVEGNSGAFAGVGRNPSFVVDLPVTARSLRGSE